MHKGNKIQRLQTKVQLTDSGKTSVLSKELLNSFVSFSLGFHLFTPTK